MNMYARCIGELLSHKLEKSHLVDKTICFFLFGQAPLNDLLTTSEARFKHLVTTR